MGSKYNEETNKLDSHTYIIGRKGHIHLNDPAVSKRHAEIQILHGEIYLRDLGSTNGTYLVKNKKLISFMEGYVQPSQAVVLGNRQYTIRHLLEIADTSDD